jgi:hypothetical protein
MFKSQGKKYFIPVTDIYSIFFENKEDKVYVDYVALDSTKSSHCLLGSRDAQLLHGKKGSHIVGALFGPFAILGTALSNPTPYVGNNTSLSENKDKFTTKITSLKFLVRLSSNI